jgi:hypothetical protein
VRIIYNVDHANPIPVPPPPEPDAQLIASLGLPSKAIAGVPDLMHHKYVVRDGESVLDRLDQLDRTTPGAAGERVVTVDSPELADAFTLDFERALAGRRRRASGFVEPRPVDVDGARCGPGSHRARRALSHRIAKKIGQPERCGSARP